MKKKLLSLLLILGLSCATWGLVGCDESALGGINPPATEEPEGGDTTGGEDETPDDDGDTTPGEDWGIHSWTIENVYAKAQELGYKGSLESFIQSISGKDGADGEDGVGVKFLQVVNGDLIIVLSNDKEINLGKIVGEDGKDGEDGKTPTIGSNKNWWINGVDTGIKAEGVDGTNGVTPVIGYNGNWWIGDQDTGVKAEGKDGADGEDGKDGVDGKTPYIGENGNWWIGDQDTGVKAEGKDGADGEKGENGANGADGEDGKDGVDGKTPYIGENGNWWIGDEDTGVKAEGKDGVDGEKGEDGANGADGEDGKDGVDGKTPYIGENGNWWIGDQDTGVKAEGKDGADGEKGENGADGEDGKDGVDGKTPYIGENGNWWIGDEDTGVKAEGKDGADGEKGEDGANGADGEDGKDGVDGKTPYIGENGNWWIGDQDTGVKAEGKDGVDGEKGEDGANGADGEDGKDGVDGKTPYIGENGNWWIGDEDTGVKAEGKDGVDGEDLTACAHSFSGWEIGVMPTCESIGYEKRVCTLCEKVEYMFYESQGHNYDGWITETLSTCVSVGINSRTCSVCDEVEYVITPVTGHVMEQTEWEGNTCTEKGWLKNACSNCDYVTYEPVLALGHNKITHTAQAATCTSVGWNEYVTCSRCDYTTYQEIPVIGHTYTETVSSAYLKSEATCTSAAIYYKSCSTCGVASTTETFANGTTTAHTYTETVSSVYLKSAATCTSAAVYYKSCSVCGVKGTGTFTSGSPNGHTYTQTVAEQYLKSAATCTSATIYYKSCNICGASSQGTAYAATFTSGSALGHDEIAHAGQAATATQAGWKDYVTCSRCDYTTYQAIPALGTSVTSDIPDHANLAVNKWDWELDQIGMGATTFVRDENDPKVVTAMHLDGLSSPGGPFATYQTNKLGDFKYSMVATMNLKTSYDLGLTSAKEWDYSTFYISFIIDSSEPIAAYARPYEGLAYFSISFEKIRTTLKICSNASCTNHESGRIIQSNGKCPTCGGTAYTEEIKDCEVIRLIRNDNPGNTAKIMQSIIQEKTWYEGCEADLPSDKVGKHFADGNAHLFEFTVERVTSGTAGVKVTFYYDDMALFSHMQGNSFTNSANESFNYPYSTMDGYLGFWTDSSLPMADAANECYVDIEKLGIAPITSGTVGSYYEKAPKHDLPLTAKTYTTQASYPKGQEIEIALTDLFSYEGDGAMTYTVIDMNTNESIGSIRNGYWVYTPMTGTVTTVQVDAKATEDDGTVKTARSYLMLNLSGEDIVVPSLDKPTLSLNENVASWNTVANAAGYEYRIGVDGENIKTNSNAITLRHNETLYVRAISSNTNKYWHSDWSDPVTFRATTLATPVVTFSANTAVWTAVEGAVSYHYQIDGGVVQNTTNTYALGLSHGQQIEVQAVGNGATTLTGAWSAPVTYTAPSLNAPYVSLNGNVASWTAVSGATGYTYKIDNGAEQNTLEMSVQLTNGQSIIVKAVGDGVTTLDSNWSNTITYIAEGEVTPTTGEEYGANSAYWTTLTGASTGSTGLVPTANASSIDAVSTTIGGASKVTITSDFTGSSSMHWGVMIYYFKWNEGDDAVTWSWGESSTYPIETLNGGTIGLTPLHQAGDWVALVMTHGQLPFIIECNNGSIGNKQDLWTSGMGCLDYQSLFQQETVVDVTMQDTATGVNIMITYDAVGIGVGAIGIAPGDVAFTSTNTYLRGEGSIRLTKPFGGATFAASENATISVSVTDTASDYTYTARPSGGDSETHTHTYDQQVNTSAYLKSEATCESAKVYYYACACGASAGNLENSEEYTYTSGGTVAHSFTRQCVAPEYLHTKATCVAKATYFYSCEYCEISDTQKIFEAGNLVDHSGGVATETQQAICENCGQPYGELVKHEHAFTREVAVSTHLKQAATCGEATQYWKTCTCGIDAAGYDHTAFFEAGEPTGKHVEGTPATTTSRAICAVCGQYYGDTLLSELSSVSVTSGYTRYDLSSALSNTTEGFGAQFDTCILESQNGLTDEEWQIQVNAMKEMNLQNARVRLFPEMYLPATQVEFEDTTNDRGYRWDSIEMTYLYKLLDAFEEIGTKVDLSWYGNRTTFRSEDGLIKGSWMADTSGEYNAAYDWLAAPTNNTYFAVAVIDCLAYLINERGYTCINEYSLFPEPEGVPNLAWPNDYNAIASSVQGWLASVTYTGDTSMNLGDILKFSGSASMEIAYEKSITNESDWGSTASSYDTTVSEISTNLEKATSSVYAFDNATSNAQMLKTAQAYVAVAAKYGMTWGIAECGTKNANTAVDNTDVETYDRAMFMARFFINMVNAGCTNIKHFVFSNCGYDGVMNNLGLINFRDENFSPKPVWFTWSLICRYTDIGSTVFPVTSSDEDVCITTLQLPDGSWTYVAANNSTTAKNIAIVNGREDRAREMNMYVVTPSVAGGTSSADLKVVTAKDSVSTVNGVAEFTIPANGVVVLSNKA